MAEDRVCYVSEAGGVTKGKNLIYIPSSTQDGSPS